LLPDIVTAMLEHQKYGSASWRKAEVGDTRLPIEPDAQASFVEVYSTSRGPKGAAWGGVFHVIVGIEPLPRRRVEVAAAVLVRRACWGRDGYSCTSTLLRLRTGRRSFRWWRRRWRRKCPRYVRSGVLIWRKVLVHPFANRGKRTPG
jgi:hypothetical protein